MSVRKLLHRAKKMVIVVANTSCMQAVARFIHRKRILFLGYHGVSPNDELLEQWTFVRVSEFRRQMEFLRGAFDCLTIDEAISLDRHHPPRPAVVVTFDDGYANNLEIALPVLAEFGIPAIVYVTTSHVFERRLFWPDKIWIAAKHSLHTSIDLSALSDRLGIYHLNGGEDTWSEAVLTIIEDVKKTPSAGREGLVEAIVEKLMARAEDGSSQIQVEGNAFTPLTPEQLVVLASHPLITIGAHSHCHRLLDQIPIHEAVDSILESKHRLHQQTGLPIDHFAYPNGNFSDSLANSLDELGFKSAVTYRPGFYKRGGDPYTIRRFGVNCSMSLDIFAAILTGVFEFKRVLVR